MGGYVPDGHAAARARVGHIAEETQVVSAAGDHLEHGRCGARRRRILYGRKNERYLRKRVNVKPF